MPTPRTKLRSQAGGRLDDDLNHQAQLRDRCQRCLPGWGSVQCCRVGRRTSQLAIDAIDRGRAKVVRLLLVVLRSLLVQTTELDIFQLGTKVWVMCLAIAVFLDQFRAFPSPAQKLGLHAAVLLGACLHGAMQRADCCQSMVKTSMHDTPTT